MIPKVLHRTVPEDVPARFEEFWQQWCDMHPDWQTFTWQDPLDPADWELGHLFQRCKTGAQLAGLVRLEVVYRIGGVYVDMDMEPLRPIDDLCDNECFVGDELCGVLPDAMFGAVPGHPGIGTCIERLLQGFWSNNPSDTGPRLFHVVLSGRNDVTVLPKNALYPYSWTEPERAGEDFPDSYAVHRWNNSWKDWQS